MNAIASPHPDARTAYDELAGHYDAFTADHDHERWISALLELAEAHGLSGRRLLDVGCGTGKSFVPFLDRGWDVTGCDLSPEMLAIAATRIGHGASERLLVADMRELPVLGSFDLVVALGDCVNYLLSFAELRRAVAAMARNLRPGGLLLFDANTLHTYEHYFRTAWDVAGAEATVHSRGLDAPLAPGAIFEATLSVGVPARGTVVTTHAQRHHPPFEVCEALRAAGLERRAVSGHGRDARVENALDEARHTKAIYLAARPESTSQAGGR